MSKEAAREALAALSHANGANADDIFNRVMDYRIEQTIAMSQPKRKPSFGSLTWTELKKKRET